MAYPETTVPEWLRPADRIRQLEAENAQLRIENERLRSIVFRWQKICARACQGSEEVEDEHDAG